MNKSHRIMFNAAYGESDEQRPLILNADYRTDNSRKEHFSFDVHPVRRDEFNEVGFCADIHKSDLVAFARWVLNMADSEDQEPGEEIVSETLELESDGSITYIYNGTVNNYYGY